MKFTVFPSVSYGIAAVRTRTPLPDFTYDNVVRTIAILRSNWMHTRSEPQPQQGVEDVTPMVIHDLEERVKQGKRKYGTALQTFNGRHALVDLYQELLDAVQYIKQYLMEEGDRKCGVAVDTVADHFGPPPSTMADHFGSPPSVSPFLSQWWESPCTTALRHVNGDRNADYGHPIFDMTRTADQWTGIFRSMLRPGARFEAEDVAQAMIAVKQSRERNQPKFDNVSDIAGYAETLGKMRKWRDDNPGIDPRTAM